MRAVRVSSQFKRDLRNASRQGRNIDLLQDVIAQLQSGEALEQRFRDHLLTGNWKNHRECHIGPNWLLIYYVTDNELRLARLGSHSELFR